MSATDPVLLTAALVPFDAAGAVDLGAVEALHQWLRDAGVNGVLAAGTTGEFVTLDDDERVSVIRSALQCFGPERVIAHIGHASSHQALRLTRRVLAEGATRFAAITPYFNPPDRDALVRHYKALREAIGDGQLYGYHFPSRSAVELNPEIHAQLVTEAALTGTKISGLSAVETLRHLVDVPGFELLTGNDALFPEVVHGGGQGMISGISSAFPHVFMTLRDALTRDDDEAVQRAQSDVLAVIDAVEGGHIALLKYAAELQGIPAGTLRITLDPPTAAQQRRVAEAVEAHGTPR